MINDCISIKKLPDFKFQFQNQVSTPVQAIYYTVSLDKLNFLSSKSACMSNIKKQRKLL